VISNLLTALFISSLCSAAGICILQQTDFLAEYSNILFRTKYGSLNEFLGNAPMFLGKLILCPYCLGTWISLPFIIISMVLLGISPIGFFVLWPSSIYVSALLSILAGKLDE
jgi:hypothetical protein